MLTAILIISIINLLAIFIVLGGIALNKPKYELIDDDPIHGEWMKTLDNNLREGFYEVKRESKK